MPTAREVAKALLNGDRPPRPLRLPIVFSLGSRIENVTLDAYRSNPTKIASALRQLRAPLHADGITCYFDQTLEEEALATTSPTGGREVATAGSWASSGEAVHRGRVPVAAEVIRRMNTLPNRDFLLMMALTGPRTLAVRLAALEPRKAADGAKEFAADVFTQFATAFLEAGADVILIQEEFLPDFSADACESWANLLAPAINVIRFYGALPILQFTDATSIQADWDAIFQAQWDCVVCVPLEIAVTRQRAGNLDAANSAMGVGLLAEYFLPDRGHDESAESLAAMIAELHPAVITTSEDVPHAAKIKRVTDLWSLIARAT